MSLFPRMSSGFGAPAFRHEYGPFFNLFNDTFNELQRLSDQLPAAHQGSFAPKFDVKEGKDAYTLEGELPGIAQKDLTIEFSDENTLTIKGHTEYSREEGTRPSSTAKPTASRIEGAESAPADNNNNKPDPTATTAEDAQQGFTTTTDTTGSTAVAHSASPPHRHTYWVSERSVGEFQRSFNFPNRVDHDNVKASLKDGILSIVVPKLAKQNTARRITVESE